MSIVKDWVEAAQDQRERDFRAVVHIILEAIAEMRAMQVEMLMKGGVLLAIRYASGRHTQDIDFSTSKHYRDFVATQTVFLSTFDRAIRGTAARLGYGIACVLQGHRLKPKVIEGNFQTLEITVGYADTGNRALFKRLLAGSSPRVVRIDYSFNELVADLDVLAVDEQHEIQAYGEITLIAEKLRAVLQQESRGRTRRQDIYDLHYLLTRYPPEQEKYPLILEALLNKAASRDLVLNAAAMQAPQVYECSKREYHTLADEIEGDLPDFDTIFTVVRSFYESLPWEG